MINSISEVTNSGAPVQELKLKNDIPRKVSFAAGEDKVELSNKEQLPAEAHTDEKKGFNKNWLYGLGALALAIGGYFAFRGKGADDVSKKGSEVLQDALGEAKGEMPKFSREMKLIKTFEANPPKFPQKGEEPVVTKLKNGEFRIDGFDKDSGMNLSIHIDKNEKMRREIYFDENNKVVNIKTYNKNGRIIRNIDNNNNKVSFTRCRYDKEGRTSRMIFSDGIISEYKYSEKNGNPIATQYVYKGGEVIPENKIKTISHTLTKDLEAIKTNISDYVKNEFITKNIETGKTEIYVPKDGNPLKPGMKLGDELVLSKTIEPFEKDGQKMVKITNAADGKVEEIPFEKYKSEHFFDD